MVVTSNERKKSERGMSINWCVAIEHQRLSSIRIIFVDYQTSKLQCNLDRSIPVIEDRISG